MNTNSSSANGIANGTSSQGNLSLFLVDDDNMLLKSLEHHLLQKQKNNFKITAFSNGEACLKEMDKKPDIVVLDYMLNGQDSHAMNGIQVLERIKAKSPETTVIMLSGQDKMQIAIDCMKYGAFDYVVKNENVFLRVQNAIKNSANKIKMVQQLRYYKLFSWIILSVITGIIATAIIVSTFFHLQLIH